MKRIFAWIAVALLAVAVLSGCTASSTHGVTVVGDNVVRIPAGETAGFYKNVGDHWYNWEITYDDDANNMHVSCTSLCPDSNTKLGDVGQTVTFYSGVILSGDFTATKQSDGSVYLHWPFAINFSEP